MKPIDYRVTSPCMFNIHRFIIKIDIELWEKHKKLSRIKYCPEINIDQKIEMLQFLFLILILFYSYSIGYCNVTKVLRTEMKNAK